MGTTFILKENVDCAILFMDKILSEIAKTIVVYIIYYLSEDV